MDQNFAIVLPLRKKLRIAPGDLITELRLLVEETGATVRMDPRMLHQPAQSGGLLSFRTPPPEVVAFELDGVRLRVALHAEPFAGRLEMGRYVNPVMWDQGLGEFTDHRAYFKIYETGIEGEEGPDAIFDRAAAVTATASVVARLTGPVGAMWLAARNSVPMRTFGAAMERLKEGFAPLAFWLRWHVIPPGEMEDLHPGLVTGGLASFVGREIMAKPCGVETRVMIDHAFELARRMIDDRLAISDNQVVEGDDAQPIRLRLSGRSRKGEAPVCEIALEAARAERAAQPVAKAAGGGAQHIAEPMRIEPGQIASSAPIGAPGAEVTSASTAGGTAGVTASGTAGVTAGGVTGQAPAAAPPLKGVPSPADATPGSAAKPQQPRDLPPATGGRRVIRLTPGNR